MSLDIKLFDAAEFLTSDERVAAYLEEAFAAGEPGIIAAALGAVAQSRSIASVAKETGLTREALYKALSLDGNPILATLTAVTKALGFHLSVKPIQGP
jgi:probable addiction module antidote protein